MNASLICLLLLVFSVTAYAGSTPTCVVPGVTSSVAYVAYLDGTSTNCFSANRRILDSSVWFGYEYGVCTQANPCGYDCAKLDACATRGFTMDGYNNCYNNGSACGVPQSYVVVTPYDDFHIQSVAYNDSLCTQFATGNNATSTTIIDLDLCVSGFNKCGYSTYAWVRLNACPPVPPDNAANGLESALSFFV